MAKLPEYYREGWRPNGPGNCRCPKCGDTVTTNALGRASHRRGCAGWQAHYAEVEARRNAVTKAASLREDALAWIHDCNEGC